MGAVRKITGAKDAKWAGRDQASAIKQGVNEQKKAYNEVAPGIAQFLMPQHAQAFGFGQPQTALAEQVSMAGIPVGGFGGAGGMDALNQMRAAMGVMGPEAQQQYFDNFQEDPGTQFLREEGLRNINRQLQARGGLGGGSRLKAITEFSQNLANQQLGQRMQDLGAMAQTDLSLAGQLAGMRTGLGNNIATGLAQAGGAEAQGRIAGAGLQNQFLGNVIQAAGQAMGSMPMPTPSDDRLKTNIEKIGTYGGVDWFKWEWNETAHKLGMAKHNTTGVIAQLLMKTHPDCVSMAADGYWRVDYPKLYEKLDVIENIGMEVA